MSLFANRPHKIFVTGGSGRPGTHLVAALVARGYAVRAVSSRPRADAAWAAEGVEWITMDWTRTLDFTGLLDGCDAVLHLGAERHDATRMMRVNVEATAALAEAAEKAAIRFFCYTSSVAVYGAPARCEVRETTATVTAEREVRHEYLADETARTYARTKLLGERAIEAAARSCEYTILRPTTVTRDEDLVAQLAIGMKRRMLTGRRRTQQIHVDDFVHAILWVTERALAHDMQAPGVSIYNLSDNEAGGNTVAALFARAHRITGDARFKAPPAAPAVLDLVAAMVKYRNPHLRRPFGMLRYSAAKLHAIGYSHAVGIGAAQDRMLRGPLLDPMGRAAD